MSFTVNLKRITHSSILMGLMFGTALNATTLRDAIEQTMNKNPDIKSEHYNKQTTRMGIKEKEAGYYPKLDLKITLEHQQKDTTDKPADAPDDTKRIDGWNTTLKFEQPLYNSGATSSEINQAKHKYYNVKYTSDEKINSTILKITNTYLDLVLNQSLKAFGDFKIVAHDYYLKLAKDKEEVSGEILDRLQVQSKIQSLIDSNLEQDVKSQKTLSTYTKLTGSNINGNICRPLLNESLVPSTLTEAIQIALKTNNKIKAQQELIQEEKAKVTLIKSKFKPNLKLQLDGTWDNSLATNDVGNQNKYQAKLVSSWNLYKGGKDSIALEKSKITMLKEKKALDSIKNDVIDEVTSTYKTYFQLKKRIDNLKKFVDINNKIVDVYREQLKEGSRTFLDLLNAETEVFRTRIMLEEEGIKKYREYFNILKSLNILGDVVLSQKNQLCKSFDINSILPNYDEQYTKNEAGLDQSLDEATKELGLEE